MTDTEGSTVTIIESVHKGQIAKRIKHFRVRIKVPDTQSETAEYLKFSDEIRMKREEGVLTSDKEDRTTLPSFVLEFPKHNEDGSYFILKCWSEVL